MNTRLIFLLSLFGLAMAFATVFWIPASAEPYFWLAIFIISAWIIGRNAAGHFFMTGFWVSIVNCIWIIIVHEWFFHTYLAHHPNMLKRMTSWPWVTHPRRDMLVVGLIVGIVCGIILGILSVIASSLVKKKPKPAASGVTP